MGCQTRDDSVRESSSSLTPIGSWGAYLLLENTSRTLVSGVGISVILLRGFRMLGEVLVQTLAELKPGSP